MPPPEEEEEGEVCHLVLTHGHDVSVVCYICVVSVGTLHAPSRGGGGGGSVSPGPDTRT